MKKSTIFGLMLFSFSFGIGIWLQQPATRIESLPRLQSMGFSSASTPQGSKPRMALVIGNGSGYTGHGFSRLFTPESDANEMDTTLSNLGFQVIKVTNADKSTIKKLVRKFTDALQSAGGGVGLFYFSGHGVGPKGSKRNFLIPIGAQIGNESDVEDASVEANWVVERMQETNPQGVNLVFLYDFEGHNLQKVIIQPQNNTTHTTPAPTNPTPPTNSYPQQTTAEQKPTSPTTPPAPPLVPVAPASPALSSLRT